jgi:heterodisulfide reductase subunit A-like polyferredoxin
MESKVGAVLVVGGGIAGIQASLDLANSGIKVYLLEKSAAIGGRMAQLDKTFPTNDCAMCIVSIFSPIPSFFPYPAIRAVLQLGCAAIPDM